MTQPPKLLVLLDIDGVLWPTTTVLTTAERLPAIGPDRASLVRRLADLGELVWASTHGWDVVFRITASVGLPSSTRAVAFPRTGHRSDGGTPKLHAVARWITRELPEEDGDWTHIVWIDDRLGLDVDAWAVSAERPVLLLRPDPRVGLTPAHVEEAEAFLRRSR